MSDSKSQTTVDVGQLPDVWKLFNDVMDSQFAHEADSVALSLLSEALTQAYMKGWEAAKNAASHQEALIDNLCMLVARMARRLRKHKEHVEDHKLAEQAEAFLRANGHLGSILREIANDQSV